MILDAILLVVWFAAAWLMRLWAEAWGQTGTAYFLSSFALHSIAAVPLFQGPAAGIIEETPIAARVN